MYVFVRGYKIKLSLFLFFRFKFVIHGGRDGYSRMLLWMKVATNNRAQTAFDAFKEAERKHGLPSRVRCDKGIMLSI